MAQGAERRRVTGRPRLLVTGFSAFPGAPVNPTEALIGELKRHHDEIAGRYRFRAEVLEVDHATIAGQLMAIAEEFAPDIALHFGLAAEATGFRLERFARNLASTTMPDTRGRMSDGIVLAGGAGRLESTLPREKIVRALAAAGLPATLDDQAGDYLCNAAFYLSRSGACGNFRPAISGFIHVPQLPEADGGLPGEGARMGIADLLTGARIAIDVCLAERKRTAGQATRSI